MIYIYMYVYIVQNHITIRKTFKLYFWLIELKYMGSMYNLDLLRALCLSVPI